MNNYKLVDGNWRHVTIIKKIVNPILRKIQFYTNKPYVIASVTNFDIDNNPIFKNLVSNNSDNDNNK